MFQIIQAALNDAEDIAFIVSEAKRDIGQQFKSSITNAPKHPSFCTESWILSEFERGGTCSLYNDGNIPAGCVAFEQPDTHAGCLNRLSRGYGSPVQWL